MTDEAMSPLRRRMIEDMSIRKFAAKTQHNYVQRVKEFAAFLGRSPGTAKSEEVRGFRLHLAARGRASYSLRGRRNDDPMTDKPPLPMNRGRSRIHAPAAAAT